MLPGTSREMISTAGEQGVGHGHGWGPDYSCHIRNDSWVWMEKQKLLLFLRGDTRLIEVVAFSGWKAITDAVSKTPYTKFGPLGDWAGVLDHIVSIVKWKMPYGVGGWGAIYPTVPSFLEGEALGLHCAPFHPCHSLLLAFAQQFIRANSLIVIPSGSSWAM